MSQRFHFSYPKNPDPSKVAIVRNRTPAIQVQTPPLEGPRTLRVGTCFLLPNQLYGVSTGSVQDVSPFLFIWAIGECTYWFWKIQLTMVRWLPPSCKTNTWISQIGNLLKWNCGENVKHAKVKHGFKGKHLFKPPPRCNVISVNYSNEPPSSWSQPLWGRFPWFPKTRRQNHLRIHFIFHFMMLY